MCASHGSQSECGEFKAGFIHGNGDSMSRVGHIVRLMAEIENTRNEEDV